MHKRKRASERALPRTVGTQPADTLALFHGDLRTLFIDHDIAATAKEIAARHGSALAEAHASIMQRSFLLLFQKLEGWVINLARWLLQAAATSKISSELSSGSADHFGTTMVGTGRDLLKDCGDSLQPSVAQLIVRARQVGVVSRRCLRTALAQCVEHHDMLRYLADSGGTVNDRSHFGWTALHMAAAFGAPQLVRSLLEMRADPAARTLTWLTPLHIAASHGSVDAAAVLVGALPSGAREPTGGEGGRGWSWAAGWLDIRSRSPEAVALSASGAEDTLCMRMLKVIQRGPGEQSTRADSAKLRKRKCQNERRLARAAAVGISPTRIDDRTWQQRSGSRCTPEAGAPPPLSSDSRAVGASSSAPSHPPSSPQASSAAYGVWGPAQLDESHCDLRVLDASQITTQELVQQYLASGTPVLVRGGRLPKRWRANWTRDELMARLGGVALPLEMYPYAGVSAAVISVPSNETRLGDLLAPQGAHSMFDRRRVCPPVGDAGEAPRFTPRSVFLSLQGWQYRQPAAGEARDIELLPALRRPRGEPKAKQTPVQRPTERAHSYGDHLSPRERRMHAKLLGEWGRPPFIHDATDSSSASSTAANLLRTSNIQFYLGGAGAGAQPHWHEAAWNWLVRGRKQWLMWPPETATYAQRHPTLAIDGAIDEGGSQPLSCIQQPGDVVLVPPWWGHATINLEPSAGFATELQFDRDFDLDLLVHSDNAAEGQHGAPGASPHAKARAEEEAAQEEAQEEGAGAQEGAHEQRAQDDAQEEGVHYERVMVTPAASFEPDAAGDHSGLTIDEELATLLE